VSGLAADLTNTNSLTLSVGSTVELVPILGVGPEGPPGPGSAAWAAAQGVVVGTVRQAPDGSWISSTASRTTRATFDATEKTFWTTVGGTTGTLEQVAQSATIATAVRYGGNRTVFLGDSITASGDHVDNPGGGEWASLVTMRSKCRVYWTHNAGIPSDTPALMLARLTTDVLDYNPDVCVVLGGTNGTEAAAKTNLAAIYDALTAAGVRVIAATIPPADADPFGKAVTLNAWINAQALARGFDVIDFYTALTDPSDGTYYPALTTDGIHPSPAGHDVMAAVALGQIEPRFPAWQPYLAAAQTDTGNLVPLPLLLTNRLLGDGVTEVPEDPRGWGSFLGTDVTRAMVSPAGVPGRMHEFTIPTTATASLAQPMTNAGASLWPGVVTAGNKVRVSIRIQTENALLNGINLGVFLDFAATDSAHGAVSYTVGLNQSSAGEIVDGVWSQEVTVPVGATRASVSWGHSAPATPVNTAKVRFGQPTLVDLGPA
jgi:lysophospholipase L1-like esterase